MDSKEKCKQELLQSDMTRHTASHNWAIEPIDINCTRTVAASVIISCSLLVVMFGPVSEEFTLYRNT
jgi:hypothetical protein